MKSVVVLSLSVLSLAAASVAFSAEPVKPAAAAAKQVAKPTVSARQGAAAKGTAQAPEVRDWAAIDTNKDNLISPEEMETYLQASWRTAKAK